MTMFLLFALGVLSGLIAYISLLPDTFKITRSIVVSASPERIYPEINELQNWPKWWPWARRGSAQKISLEGSPLGPGAICEWSGDDKVSAGKVKITESSQNERIRGKLKLDRPIKAVSDIQFDLKGTGEAQTEIVCTMSGRNEFVGKAAHFFMNMDKLFGGQFEQGLAALKSVAEAPAE